ncbi:MAG TPA: TQO small subunit DoxD [Candidatus Paceibacterota bacterium]|nr:TQO small subunit DoxD [Candidatus Paceibacterota bacterium]
MASKSIIEIPEPKAARFLFADTRMGWLWLVVRLYVGYEWLVAGWDKIVSPAWAGPQAGAALKGFLNGALQQTTGAHPNVAGWYAAFLSAVVLPHAMFFANLVSFGELAVGAALILGVFTGIASFFGAFMNVNYLFAGALSVNPLLLLLEIFLILAWRTAGWIGLDRWLLPEFGVPWQHGTLFDAHHGN